MSWMAFCYGAFDPKATITIDKSAGAFLPQALSARIFGFHPWSPALPQAIEGVVSVLVMYRRDAICLRVPRASRARLERGDVHPAMIWLERQCGDGGADLPLRCPRLAPDNGHFGTGVRADPVDNAQ